LFGQRCELCLDGRPDAGACSTEQCWRLQTHACTSAIAVSRSRAGYTRRAECAACVSPQARYRSCRSRRIGCAACSQGIARSFESRRAPGETGSVPIHRPLHDTAEHTFAAGREEPACRYQLFARTHGPHAKPPFLLALHPRSSRSCSPAETACRLSGWHVAASQRAGPSPIRASVLFWYGQLCPSGQRWPSDPHAPECGENPG
jgi:hypothetical protein